MAGNDKIDRPGGIRGALWALRHRNYRLYFMGQGISLTGTWMQTVATGWLVFRMTHSAFMLGLVGFTSQLPVFFLSPFAGVLSDRMSRLRTLLVVQALAMLQALALAAITITGVMEVWHIVLLSLMLGFINAFDMPTRQAFVIEMVEDKADLGNAIALNSSLFNGTRLVGPAIAGFIIDIAGEGICFLVNGLSFVAVIAGLAAMRIPAVHRLRPERKIAHELKEGFRYAIGFTPIRDLLMLVSMISFIGMTFPVLLPVFTASVLHGGSHTYGFLVASAGMGAITGTIYLATRKSVVGLGRIIKACMVFFGLGLLLFSWSRWMPVSMLMLAVTGFGMIVSIASCNTILQTIVDEDKRGRVMSFYTMAFMGAAPLGSIISGSLSSFIGAPLTVRFGSILVLAVALTFAWRLPDIRMKIRPIYRKMGIIPEVALGIQSATDLQEPE